MAAMELIALKADPAALAKGAFNGADQAGRGVETRPGFETFADILAASESARRKDEAYQQAFDDSGMDALEEESLLREAEEEKEQAESDKPAQDGAPAGRATVTEFLPFQLRPQLQGEGGQSQGELQQQLLASTATQAVAGPAQAQAAPQQAALPQGEAVPGAELQAGLATINNRASWRQDAMAEAAVRRGDKRDALVQPAAAGATSLGAVFGKGTAPGNLILAAGGQVGGQGQNGNSGSQSNLGGQNGQSPTQLPTQPLQAQADPAAVQARAEQFAAALNGQGAGQAAGREMAGRAGQAAGAEALRAEAAGAASQAPGQSAAQAAQATNGQPTATQLAQQADQAHKSAQTQAQQAPQQARAPLPQPPVEQVAVRIASMAKDGMDQIRIQLEPADLGRVDVRLHMQDGAVTATVMADNQDTLDLLQRDSRSLQQALQDAGLKTNSDGLNFSLRDDGRGAPTDDGKGGRDFAGRGNNGEEGEGLLSAEAAAVEAQQWKSDRALDIVA